MTMTGGNSVRKQNILSPFCQLWSIGYGYRGAANKGLDCSPRSSLVCPHSFVVGHKILPGFWSILHWKKTGVADDMLQKPPCALDLQSNDFLFFTDHILKAGGIFGYNGLAGTKKTTLVSGRKLQCDWINDARTTISAIFLGAAQVPGLCPGISFCRLTYLQLQKPRSAVFHSYDFFPYPKKIYLMGSPVISNFKSRIRWKNVVCNYTQAGFTVNWLLMLCGGPGKGTRA